MKRSQNVSQEEIARLDYALIDFKKKNPNAMPQDTSFYRAMLKREYGIDSKFSWGTLAHHIKICGLELAPTRKNGKPKPKTSNSIQDQLYALTLRVANLEKEIKELKNKAVKYA